MAGKAAKKAVGFEEELSRLEALAAELETGELPLEELIGRYEEGMKLAAELEKMLEAARGRLQELSMGKDGSTQLTPTDAAEQKSLLDALEDQ